MAANVESMVSVREKPWHGLGVIVNKAMNSEEAITLSGLNWKVEGRPIYDAFGAEIKGFKANTRDSDNSILGVVSDKYQIIQNSEAFEFTDSLISNGNITYETAGSLRKGRQIWLLANMPKVDILGDDIEPYICFTNTHDGTGAIKVCMTPIRVVCNNTLNLAIDSAKRIWSTKHMGDLKGKLQEAQETLGMAKNYMEGLRIEAEKLAQAKITEGQIEQVLNEMFPIDYTKDTERKINNINIVKDNIIACYMRPDVAKFIGTKWGFINAMADMVDHTAPVRKTDTYQANNWGRIMMGHPFVDTLVKQLKAVA